MDLKSLTNHLESLLFPVVKEGSERPVEPGDFSLKLPTWEKTFSELCPGITEDILNKENKTLVDEVACFSILAVGQFSEDSVWTTPTLKHMSLDVQKKVLSALGFQGVREALTDDKGHLFVLALKKLRSVLSSQDWKNYPTAVVSFSWILRQVESPHFGEHLDLLLPTALLIVDDFVTENQCRGLLCLDHIVDNTASMELSSRGFDGVIFNVLEKALYRNEPAILGPAGACCLKLLQKTHSQILYSTIEWSKYDDFLEIIIKNMRLEQRLDLRKEYITLLPRFLKGMGLSSCRLLPSLLEVFDEYLIEPTSSEEALKALNVLLGVTWPSIIYYKRKLLNVLLKTLYDATSPQTRHPVGLRSDLVTCIVECMYLSNIQELKLEMFPVTDQRLFDLIQEINQISSAKYFSDLNRNMESTNI